MAFLKRIPLIRKNRDLIKSIEEGSEGEFVSGFVRTLSTGEVQLIDLNASILGVGKDVING